MSQSSDTPDALGVLRRYFDSLAVGDSVSHEVTFDAETVAEYAAQVQLQFPGRYLDRDGRAIVPPGMLYVGPQREFGLQEGPRGARGGIFTGTNRTFLRPVLVGERIRYEGSIAEKYMRKGRFFIDVTWRALDEIGEIVASGTEAHTLGMVREEPQ